VHGRPLEEERDIGDWLTVVEAAPFAVVVLDADHVVIAASEAAKRRGVRVGDRYVGPGTAPLPVRLSGLRRGVVVYLPEDKARDEDRLTLTLARFTDAVRAMRSPEPIVACAMTFLREALAADRCVCAEVEEDGDHFTFLGGSVKEGVAPVGGRYPVSAFGRDALATMRAGEPFVADDILSSADEGAQRATAIRALIAVPLVKEGKLIAGVGIHVLSPRSWTPEDVRLAVALSERCWESIERQRMQKELRESEARYRSIVDEQVEMVCRFRRDGTIVFANRAYAEARATTPAELVGTNLWAFVAAEDRQRVAAMLDALSPDAPEVKIENRFETAAGERWTLWSNRVLVFDEQGRWQVGQSSGLDITERKRFEIALEEANRRKNEFLAMLAHELRNPLAPIRTAVEVLEMLALADPRQQKATAVIERQVNHLARLLDDLLDVARITRGKIVLTRARTNVKGVLGTVFEMIQPLATRRKQEVVLTLPEEDVFVDGDGTRLVQVFDNIVQNASKYTPEGGRIRIELEPSAASVQIRVADDGDGIPPELLPRIFDLFIQGPRSIERTQGGLGIGLTLVKEIVSLHDGHVEARSEGSGRGTEIQVTLPRLVASDHPPIASPRRQAPASRVLVVEDNTDAREMLAAMLTLAGHEVHAAATGEEGLRLAVERTPDIVISDIGLPGMDGYELARRLRAHAALRRTWLVALSGYGRREDKVRAAEAGFDHHLVKPVEPGALTELLASLEAGRVSRP